MRAAVVRQPGGPEVLELCELPVPEPRPGWVLIRVRAFGLNRAELFTRQGHSPGVELPRVIGIECVGQVEAAPGGEVAVGATVAAIMGGMGRQFDGSYAEYTLVPASSVFAVDTRLDWSVLGALPEMFQTTYGSLTAALEVGAGDVLLVRGGTSSIGMTAIAMARDLGARVIATSRQASRAQVLRDRGADDVVIDGGDIAEAVRDRYPDGVDRVLELIGTRTLIDSMRCARPRGVVCMTGILGGAWVLDRFEPMVDIPTGVRLTSYSGGAGDLDPAALQRFVSQVETGAIDPRVDRVFGLDDIVEAHRYMEANQATGKCVVRVS